MFQRKEYFKTLMLEDGGVIWLVNNKTCNIHGVSIIILKIFNYYELFLSMWGMFQSSRELFLSISTFDDLAIGLELTMRYLKI